MPPSSGLSKESRLPKKVWLDEASPNPHNNPSTMPALVGLQPLSLAIDYDSIEPQQTPDSHPPSYEDKLTDMSNGSLEEKLYTFDDEEIDLLKRIFSLVKLMASSLIPFQNEFNLFP
ncbi:hypothetical protein V6N11_075634 [Hibiscus sabdariffa]|uniref:Uncharacterized protein n=2 Tax=Hibiscus sabdariffa TaxID=183260 RepID=A0ABR1ZN26_9ROSI